METIKNTLSNILSILEKEKDSFKDPSVESGTMGLAIFYYYCHAYFNDDHFLHKAEEMVEKSINLLSAISNSKEFSSRYVGDSISSVISSFGKGLLFIENKFKNNYDFYSYYSLINNTLQELLDEDIKRNDYDFFSGALSSGYYFLNKFYYSDGSDSESYGSLLKIFESSKKSSLHYNENEVYWIAPEYHNQVYLGLSHGSAMMINFWTKLHKLNIINFQNKEENLWLTKAVSFVFNRKRNCIDGYFPHKAFSNEEIKKTQLSMCYGDLGILYAMFNANEILKNDFYQTEIDKMLLTTSLREQDPALTYDTGILYGASGIVYVFDYFSKNGKISYLNTINYWQNQLVHFRTKNNDFVYGFKDDKNISAKYSFMWGISGIGICLMQSQCSELPSLHELLLTGI